MINALDTAQAGPPPDLSSVAVPEQWQSAAPEAVNPKSEILNPKSDTLLLTQEERRQILARIARVNPLDCFDASGAFDLDRARLVLPPGSISRLTVHEITKPSAEGQPVTERRIDVGLFNPVAALRLDEQMERRRERDAATASSQSESDSKADSTPPLPNTPEYGRYLIRQKIAGLEKATPALALLKKALAEKQDRHRQLRKALAEKDHQRAELQSEVEDEVPQRSQALQSRDQSREAGFATPLSGTSEPRSLSNGVSQCETGCQPVQENPQTSTGFHPEPKPKSRTALQSHDHSALTPATEQNAPNKSQGRPSPLKSPDQIPYHELPRRKLEIEDMRSTSSPTVFAAWLKATATEPPGYRTGAPRPPPEYGPLSMMSQGRCRIVE